VFAECRDSTENIYNTFALLLPVYKSYGRNARHAPQNECVQIMQLITLCCTSPSCATGRSASEQLNETPRMQLQFSA
jgi:hypothetical protein